MWANKIALINVVSPRRALQAYLLSLREADLDGNGELNVKEILKSTRKKCEFLIYSEDLSNEQLHKLLDEIINGDDINDSSS